MKRNDFFQIKAWKKWDKSQWMILVLVGVLLMVIALPTGEKKEKKNGAQPEAQNEEESVLQKDDYVGELERKLANSLSKIDGAGRVEVMITLEDGGESVVEKDTVSESSDLSESDPSGGLRTEKSLQTSQTTVYEEEGVTPFVEKERMPKIAGVFVAAQGGDHTAVKQNISDAVMALFQIDVNRIKVVKMNMQEEGY